MENAGYQITLKFRFSSSDPSVPEPNGSIYPANIIKKQSILNVFSGKAGKLEPNPCIVNTPVYLHFLS